MIKVLGNEKKDVELMGWDGRVMGVLGGVWGLMEG